MDSPLLQNMKTWLLHMCIALLCSIMHVHIHIYVYAYVCICIFVSEIYKSFTTYSFEILSTLSLVFACNHCNIKLSKILFLNFSKNMISLYFIIGRVTRILTHVKLLSFLCITFYIEHQIYSSSVCSLNQLSLC